MALLIWFYALLQQRLMKNRRSILRGQVEKVDVYGGADHELCGQVRIIRTKPGITHEQSALPSLQP